jgi:hypothetical protein
MKDMATVLNMYNLAQISPFAKSFVYTAFKSGWEPRMTC